MCLGPNNEKGIYFVCSSAYDKSLYIRHSLREKKISHLVRNIDPDCIRVLDFNVSKKKHKTLKGYQRVEIRFVSMRDDEFLFDFIEFDEKLIPHDPVLNHKKAQPP